MYTDDTSFVAASLGVPSLWKIIWIIRNLTAEGVGEESNVTLSGIYFKIFKVRKWVKDVFIVIMILKGKKLLHL